MKRRQPLRADPGKTAAWQRRSRKPLPAQGRKALREEGDLDAFRAAVARRSGGRCELAAPACDDAPHPAAHAHHVWPEDRDRGVHDPDRGLHVCAAGHRYVHEHPAMAAERGWLRGRS